MSGYVPHTVELDVPEVAPLIEVLDRLELRDRAFAESLIKSATQLGRLSDKQLYWVRELAKRAPKIVKSEDGTVTVKPAEGEYKSIVQLLVNADMARPVLRFGTDDHGFRISKAPESGVNAGCVYIKTDAGEYLGKIVQSGHMRLIGSIAADVRESLTAALQALVEDPEKAISDYGHRTGICGCCGRTLSNAESIALGIGPICRGKWGL